MMKGEREEDDAALSLSLVTPIFKTGVVVCCLLYKATTSEGEGDGERESVWSVYWKDPINRANAWLLLLVDDELPIVRSFVRSLIGSNQPREC